MVRTLLLPAVFCCFGLNSNLQAQYDPYAPPGMQPYGQQGIPARCSGNNCNHSDQSAAHQCSPGSSCSHDHGAAASPMPYPGQFQPSQIQPGQVQRPYGQFQPNQMMASEYGAPPMAGAQVSGCPLCAQGAAPIPGNVAYPSRGLPPPGNQPNNSGPRSRGPRPTTFAAAPPMNGGNRMQSPDSHAGHDHANHNHGDHDHADHQHADHNHAGRNQRNPQPGDLAQARPRLTGPALPPTPERGTAQVLQNDTPLMSRGEQLGTIDRGQSLKVLNIQGNWVQLETNWLGKNAWTRKEHVLVLDANNYSMSGEVAPPAN